MDGGSDNPCAELLLSCVFYLVIVPAGALAYIIMLFFMDYIFGLSTSSTALVYFSTENEKLI